MHFLFEARHIIYYIKPYKSATKWCWSTLESLKNASSRPIVGEAKSGKLSTSRILEGRVLSLFWQAESLNSTSSHPQLCKSMFLRFLKTGSSTLCLLPPCTILHELWFHVILQTWENSANAHANKLNLSHHPSCGYSNPLKLPFGDVWSVAASLHVRFKHNFGSCCMGWVSRKTTRNQAFISA